MEALPKFGLVFIPRDLDYPAQYATCHWKVLRHGKRSLGVDGSAGLRLPWPPLSLHPVHLNLEPPSCPKPRQPTSTPTTFLVQRPLCPSASPFDPVRPRCRCPPAPPLPVSVSSPFSLTTWAPASSPLPLVSFPPAAVAAPASSRSRPPHHHHGPPVDPAVSLLPGGVSTGGSSAVAPWGWGSGLCVVYRAQ